MSFPLVILAADDPKSVPDTLRDAKPEPGPFAALQPLFETVVPPFLWLTAICAVIGLLGILFYLANGWRKGSKEDLASAGKKAMPIAFVLVALAVVGPVLATLISPAQA